MKTWLFRIEVAVCAAGLAVGLVLTVRLLGFDAGAPTLFVELVRLVISEAVETTRQSPTSTASLASWSLIFFSSAFYFAQTEREKRLALLMLPAGTLAVLFWAIGRLGFHTA